jgi:hypothetical protein
MLDWKFGQFDNEFQVCSLWQHVISEVIDFDAAYSQKISMCKDNDTQRQIMKPWMSSNSCISYHIDIGKTVTEN